ncbi:MAG: FimB/Mfa2 family fimbrial subunit [Odoribacteraceae bacterium]|jgi:uncharacterized protein (TIGR02145 family)|nr:FimB/Mfa2 family fimbrial subunit [Odoribacteraceae bacterium]
MKQMNERVNDRKTRKTSKLFLLAALALFAEACVVNLEEGELAPAIESGERLVTLALSVPGPPVSRGLTTDDESEVKTIDVLLFNANANEYFQYRAIGDIDPATGKKFSVKLPGGTWNVVVLANAGEAFGKLVNPYKSLLAPATLAPDLSTVSRRDVLERLVLQLDDKTAKWPEGTFKGIPMWGYYDNLEIKPTTPSPAASINLMRAVARVNVSVVDDDDLDEYDVTGVFELASVRLYNYSRAGSIAPAAVNGAGYDAAQWNGSRAILPNLPALSLLVDVAMPRKVLGPLAYDVLPAQKHEYHQEIYTFEAAAGAGTTLSANTCLVIGGRYNGVLSYYRVDFVKSDGTYLSLLRNHSYNVKITGVFAAGYASIDEAFDNKPSNIKVEITEEDETIKHVAFNDQNFLGASAGEITIPANAKNGHRFTVNTDVADGWKITGTSATDEPHVGLDVSWITGIAPASGSAGITTSVTFNASENASGARRVGYIHLQAGRLHLAVKVTQLAIGIWITDAGGTDIQELVFNSTGGAQPAGESFVVHWLPTGAQVNAMMIPVSQRPAFDYDPAHDTPGEGTMTDVSDPSGYALLTVQPAALTAGEIGTFVEKASLVRFTAFHDGDFAPADIELRHADYHTVVDVEAYYMIGNVHSFTVRSNTSWEISDTYSDPDGILDLSYTPSLFDRSGGHSSTGEKVYFKLVNDVTKDAKTAELTLVDPTGLVGNVIVTIKGMACGTGGIVVTKHIGSNDYATHLYAGKCWMVNNSREGTYFAQYYNGNNTGLVGYYYTWAQATTVGSVCPSGWHLPTVAEATDLVTEINDDLSSSKAQWWGGPGMLNSVKVGHYWFNNSTWNFGGIRGEWWCATSTQYFFGTTASMIYPDNGATNGYCVRCVQD